MKRLAFAAVLLLTHCAPAVAQTLPIRPDPTLTPGANDPEAVDASLTYDDLCPHANTKARRHVTAAMKRQVFAEYGLDPHLTAFEVDHLCSLELGCTNSIKNLWPQAYTTQPWNAHLKDAIEDHLHALACARLITFDQARVAISTDWIAAYQRYIGVSTTPPN